MEQEKIGKFIASCRKEQGFTQAVLAEKLGITDRAVSKWETGRSLPDTAETNRIIKRFLRSDATIYERWKILSAVQFSFR